jgi:arginyl-tRNA--protein-N-Asp/Glu arginylyltransferase
MNIEDLAIYKRLLSKFTDNKKKALDGLNAIKEILNTESKETSEMLEIYRKYIAGEELDEDAIKKANNQFTDLIKNAGLLGVFALPGGLVAIAFLVKLGKKFGIDILPKSFK